MKTSIKDIEVEELKLSDFQIEFASEETDIGISLFATGEIVAFWGSDSDPNNQYNETVINLVDEKNLKALWKTVRELGNKEDQKLNRKEE